MGGSFTTILYAGWLTLAGVIGTVWAFRFLAMGIAVRRRAILGSTSHPHPLASPPRVSVLVAARDEEANIEACVSTLLDQDYPNFEVIAVDDRSVDETPAILKRLEAQSDGRLSVVTVLEPRDGWFGKNNAMREGVAVSTGDWLLFTDADCRQTSRRTLSVAMAEVVEKGVDFLSVIPLLDTPTVWERIIQPVCSWVLILWFLPDRVNNPEKKTAYANGAFMLMSRRCYEGIGGHERVRAELNEDTKMARFAKRGGFVARVTENEDLYRTRMYRTPREAWRGWSRIFYGTLGTLRRLGISMAMLVAYSLLPWIALVISGAMWLKAPNAADAAWRNATMAWLLVVVLQIVAAQRYNSIVRIGRGWALTHVIGASVALAMLGNAVLKALGATSTTWRGTIYRRDNEAQGIRSPVEPNRTRADPRG